MIDIYILDRFVGFIDKIRHLGIFLFSPGVSVVSRLEN